MAATRPRDVSLNRVFDCLASSYRRAILTALLEQPRVELETFHRQIATIDRDRARYRHVHLPKLDRAGLIDWDRTHGVIARGTHFSDVRPCVEILQQHLSTWPA